MGMTITINPATLCNDLSPGFSGPGVSCIRRFRVVAFANGTTIVCVPHLALPDIRGAWQGIYGSRVDIDSLLHVLIDSCIVLEKKVFRLKDRGTRYDV